MWGKLASTALKAGKLGGRKAGQTLNWLAWDPIANQRRSTADLAMRLGYDAVFGGLAAAQTPGDIGDKAIAGLMSAGGGGVGGLALGRLGGKNQYLTNVLDMAGSIGGDFGGMALSDASLRLKDRVGGGMGQTPWEKMGSEQQADYAKELEQQILRQYGIFPGTREQYARDDFMIDNGLG